MKKFLIIFSVLASIIIIAGIYKFDYLANKNNYNADGNKITKKEINDKKTANKKIKRPNKLCAWIDQADLIISLDLPEKYAHFNERTIFPAYETGFMFRSTRGETARIVKLARKQCAYRVGFSKKELNNIPGRFFPIAYKGKSGFLTYKDEPKFISLQENGLPEQGKLINLKIKGETTNATYYDKFLK